MIVRGAPIRNADGTVREWIGTCVDVTEFKLADDAARFRSRLLDATGESIIATDPAGTIIYINQFAADQFGCSVEDATGANIMEVTVPTTSREQAEEIMEQLRRGEIWTGEFMAHRHDGTLFPIRASNTPLFDEAGKLVAIIGVARDMTERHASEQALRQSEERYRAAFDQAAVGVAQIAFDGTFERVNPRLCDLLGYSAEELRRLKFSDITHPEDLARSVRLLGEVLEHEREYFALAKRYIRKDGGVMWASSTVSLMRDRKGNPQSLIAIVEDISAQKEAEFALQRREAELRALTARLNTAHEDEARRIARELHDELGQALTAIAMETADAQRRLAQGNGSSATEIQCHLASVRALLDQAMGTTRRVCTELRPALLDQVGFVPALEWQAHDFESRSGIFCSLKLPEPAPEIGGELATALYRIFQEILTNVARHSEATEVTVDLTSSASEVCLTVQDNGRGMTNGQAAKPSGLGLIGIRERTLGVGGTASFEGKEGHGTRVSIVVPLPAGNAEAN
jgi:two-component system sensor histidine kinase UhpB